MSSAAAAAFFSGPSHTLPLSRKVEKGAGFDHHKTRFLSGSGGSRRTLGKLSSSAACGSRKKPSFTTPRRRLFSPAVMEWQDSRAEIEVDIPCSLAYACYSDREVIPQWMPFISSVQVLKDKPDLSRWSLKYEVFGRNVEFSWLARNMQPIPNQKIHWRSLEGLPNKGVVRFFPRGPSACKIELTVSYEVPEILRPVASALKPFLEGLLLNGLQRFVTVARGYERKIPS
ncbi:Uncharacterized protein M6B38_210030 [Iris pallida]|uniref:Coenzyme Q-binding protein COQ10 START domain-containing protein n=1 Tax=Iris pallida TaxID=29817 RepID=A0AAX6E3D3_IRIPA|nr:Uncharacterized protein M6B38_210030 [Iris pallida]